MLIAEVRFSSHASVSTTDLTTAEQTAGKIHSPCYAANGLHFVFTVEEPLSSDANVPTPLSIFPHLIGIISGAMVLLLLLAVGGVLFLVCVLRAKASGREDGERVYDTIQETEVIRTWKNSAYGLYQGEEERYIHVQTDAEYEEVH